MVSVLFSKAKIAAACAGILYFMSYVPYLYIAVREEGAHEIVSVEAKLTAVSVPSSDFSVVLITVDLIYYRTLFLLPELYGTYSTRFGRSVFCILRRNWAGNAVE